ncbi:PAS domain-containing sensor histidine kinase [Spirosoma koreense]
MNGNQKSVDSSQTITGQVDVQLALQATGLGVWECNPATQQVSWDDRCRALFGLAKDNLLTYQQAIQYIHPEDVERVNQALQRALAGEANGNYDQTYRTIGADDGQLRWVRFYGSASFSQTGELNRLAGVAQEVTQQVLIQQRQAAAHQQAQRQQRIHEAITATTPDLMYVFDLTYRFTYANQALLEMWGKSWEESIGKSLLENGYEPWHAQMHELEIDQVVATKQRIRGEVSFPHATLGKRIYDYVLAPVLNEQGEVEAVAGTTRDITDIRQAQQRIQESQRQLLDLFEQSPVALATYSADEAFVIQWANAFFGELVARPPQAIVGKPLLEALPELQGQGFESILRNVVATGAPFMAPERPVGIRREGKLTTIYVDLTYQPQKKVDGTIQSILVVATDVTQQVKARRQLEEREAFLQSILDLAQIGVYTIDLTTSQLTKSPRLADWYGLPERTDVATSMSVIEVDDLQRIHQMFSEAIETSSHGYYNLEYGVVNAQTGQKRVLRTTGQLIYNAQGQPVGINGSVVDITAQRALQLALEEQVHQRTQELAAANEELAATNEELAATNQEYVALNHQLEETNLLLNRSNQNLQQFAYVASHDLQEPLRKIQQFGDLLSSHYSGVGGDAPGYLERMQSAARRMSVLIKDLLELARLTNPRETSQPVALEGVVNGVLTDLEMLLEETEALVEVAPLPMIVGDAGQLGQLFQNLLSNALKFRRPQVAPSIQITYQRLGADSLPPLVKPARMAPTYHQIQVIDNGIGFEAKYVERIFEVFQRLHGKGEYAGTGIGLAICERVVSNHGGAIMAYSQPNQGATFTIYLPE